MEAIKLFLSQPNRQTLKGSRDFTMLSIMIETGTRVQEIADLTPSKVHFGSPTIINIRGKGGKNRVVPLSKQHQIF
jgi:integrase/recombinase XerD